MMYYYKPPKKDKDYDFIACLIMIIFTAILYCLFFTSCSSIKPYYMENSFVNEQIRRNLDNRHKSEFIVNKPYIYVWDRLTQYVSSRHINPNIDIASNVIIINEPIKVHAVFADTRDRYIDAFVFAQPLNKYGEKYKCRSSIKYNIYVQEIDSNHTKVKINIFGNGIEIRKVGTNEWVKTNLDGTTTGVMEKQIKNYILKK